MGLIYKVLSSFLILGLMGSNSWLHAQESTLLRVYSSNGVKAVLEDLQPDIERAIETTLSFEFSTSRTLADKVESGGLFDVVILTPALIDELIASKKVDRDSRARFSQVGVGVGSRQGTLAKSVSTLDDLRETLLGAVSIAYGANGQSRRTNEASFATLGITEEIQAKSRLTGPGEGPKLVAEGEVELVLTLVSELLREPGVQFLGTLPPEVQNYIQFEAAMGVAVSDSINGKEFIRFLSSPEFSGALEKHGLEFIGQ